jgi:hypothetical protein
MHCIICHAEARYYFSKHFDDFGIGEVEYWRCNDCGFTLSKTHADMTSTHWERVNRLFHEAFFGRDVNALDPRWLLRLGHQSRMLGDAVDIGLLSRRGRWLDYGCGDAKLADLAKREHNLTLLKYDEYLSMRVDYLKTAELVEGGYDFVLTTSVFEHLAKREHFDRIEALVSDSGVMGIHTLVRDSIPNDPDWFYLHPVHCAFHTNESMRRLLKQWGYVCSVYNVEAQLWLCFKGSSLAIESIVRKANQRPDMPKYLFEHGFVGYWK